MKAICLFCNKNIERKKSQYGICITCKVDMLRTVKKKEYSLLVKGEDVKIIKGRLIKELKGQGYKVIK